MAYRLEPSDVMEIVNDYIGVEGGYLGDFSYRTHREFYPYYCNLPNINPDDMPGTTRERFIQILASAKSTDQLKILKGLLKKYPLDKFEASKLQQRTHLHNKILDHIKKLEVTDNTLNSLKLVDLQSIDTAFETYRAIEVLGEGGAGRVFKVSDSTGRDHAIKFLNPDKLNQEKLKRFKNEVFFSLRISHSNILKASDVGYFRIGKNKFPFYVMPYFANTFRHVINSDSIDPTKKMLYFNSLMDALAHTHSLGCWHRDIKPENILVNPNTDELVLSDFGIAHISEEYCSTYIETKDTTRLANFQYAAPEQRIKARSADQRSDIYALGLLLNEMFTKTIPSGASYKRIAEYCPQFSFLDSIVERMIQQEPSNRFESIAKIKSALGL